MQPALLARSWLTARWVVIQASGFRRIGDRLCICSRRAQKYITCPCIFQLKKIVTHPTMLRDVVGRVNERQESEVRPLQRRLPEIEKERRRQVSIQQKYYQTFEKGDAEPEEFRSRLAEISERLAELDREETETRAKINSCEAAGRVPFEAVKLILDDFVRQLQWADTARQRVLLQALVKEVTIEKGRGVSSLQLHLQEDIVRALGLPTPPGLPGPVSLTM